MFDKVLSAGDLPDRWNAFEKKPESDTAEALVNELKELDTTSVGAALTDIAGALTTRLANQRGDLFPLIVSRMDRALAVRLFEAVVAAHRAGLALTPRPRTQTQQEAPPKLTRSQSLDGLSTRPRDLPGRDRLMLEGLDLAAPEGGTVDLVDIAKRADEVADESAMGYLWQVAQETVKATRGQRTYSRQRIQDIGKLVAGKGQEHLVEQIGFRSAKSRRGATGLSTSNLRAITYWRTGFISSARKFIEQLKLKALSETNDTLVNSPKVRDKLTMVVGQDAVQDFTVTPLGGTSGISILSGLDKHQPKGGWEHVLRELGATPSPCQLYQLMDAGKDVPKPDFAVDTWADLMTLITSVPFARLRQIARDKGPVAPVCAMVEHLVLGLTENRPERYDPLTANALRSLRLLLDIVVVSEQNPTMVLHAVDLMMDEIAIVVAVAGGYTRTDYQQTMLEILLERAPSLKGLANGQIEVDSQLTSSGMDALGTALWIALSSRDHDQVSRATETVDYYETGDLLAKLKRGERSEPREGVLIAALNSSAPFDPPQPQKLVDDVTKALREHRTGEPPFVLIIDITIETEGNQLDVILGSLRDAVAAGQLEIYLCKSFQKYASLGTGMVAAGNLTMLSKKGNLDSAYARAEALLQDLARDLARQDEGQLIIHMLKYGHSDELALVASAADNARFINEFCWPIDWTDRRQGSDFVPGIPLLLRTTQTGDVNKLFEKLSIIDWRDSFSFLRTSYVGEIDNVGGVQATFVRINPGHESKEAMTEYFYAFGHLATGLRPDLSYSKKPADLAALTIHDVGEHLEALKTLNSPYHRSIEASYCAFAILNLADKGDWAPLLIQFFRAAPGTVTIETQRFLARKLFKPAPTGFLKADPATLAALCRAAEVLPAWERKASALAGKLHLIGDSADAERLRALFA